MKATLQNTPPVQQKKPGGGLRIVLIAVAALVVLGGAGVGAFLLLRPQPQPVVSVTSNYQVDSTPAGAIGTALHVSGQQFSNNSTITFLLDGAPISGERVVESDVNGKVRADLAVTKDWGVGKHTLTARDAGKHTTKVGVPVVIVLQGQAHTPGPNGAPSDDMNFSLKVTIERRDASTGKSLGSLDETLIVSGGTVCQSRDNGQTFNASPHGDEFRNETYVYECSGTYRGGELSYTETVTSIRFSSSDGTYEVNSPTVIQHLEGTFTNQNTISGTYSSDAYSLPLLLIGRGYNMKGEFTLNAETGAWTGTLV